jgi:hypothetical protein
MRYLVLCGGALLLAAGCSRGPTLAPVSGRVFYRGKPLSGGTIVFTPAPERGNSGPLATSAIGPDGRYTLSTDGKKGAVPGWHRITIASAPKSTALPRDYRDPELSGLVREVKPGDPDPIDLHLD